MAEWVSSASGKKLDREAVYKWAVNGIPWKWRPFVAKMATEKNVVLPPDFMPGIAA